MPIKQPTTFDQAYPGRFLKAGTLAGKKVTLTLTKVEHEALEGEKGVETKVVFSFRETEMGMVCCKTNAVCIREMFGSYLSEWVGKRITLYEGKVESGSMKGQPCIRIWGSPDIPADMPIQIKLPKKKPFPVVMHKVEPKTSTPQQ